MAILKKILFVLLVILVILLIVAFVLPRNVRVERTVVIDAPAATVFTLVNGYKSFNQWSPWYDRDPGAEYAFEGPEFGVGARMSWSGDPKAVGSGSQEVVESRPFGSVVTRLDFGDEGSGTARFTILPAEDGTQVTWGFETDLGMNPASRYFGLLLPRFIAADYDEGLERLKRLAESLPDADFSDLVVETVEVEPQLVAFVPGSSGKDEEEIAAAIGAAYAQVARFLAAQGLRQVAPPLTINTRWDEEGHGFDAAIPVDAEPRRQVSPDSAVQIRRTYGGKALRVIHVGPYRGLEAAYEKLIAYMAAHGLDGTGYPWDEYVSDPGTTAEAELITNIYWPVD
jgi:effector-binding domain-containing protein/uncharacterized protein YndB with AHSA1/START domain